MKKSFSINHLTPEQVNICVGRATEVPFSGKYLYNKEDGVYSCVACENALFSSKTKYDSGSGWPSFYDVLRAGTIKLQNDLDYGMRRTEVLCANCEAHLGHVFDDGPIDKTGKRYCINSLALNFKKLKE